MRSTQDWNMKHRTVLFNGDSDRGCLVVLPSGIEMDTADMNKYKPFFDPVDKLEVFYPGWAEW